MIADHLWQSTLVLGLAAALTFALRRHAARVRHAIWLAASIKFLVPFAALSAAGAAIGPWVGHTPNAQVSVALVWIDRSLAFTPFAARSTAGLPAALPGVLLWIAMALWAAGSLALVGWRLRAWRTIAAAARRSVPIGSGREERALDVLRRRSNRPLKVSLLQSNANLEPGVVGLFRPALLWPSGLSDRLDDRELEAVLAHEISHVEHRDNLAGAVQMLVETIFWFHPLVWWLSARLVNERERAADEAVLAWGAERRSYAEALIKVCSFFIRSPLPSVAGVGGSNLTERVEDIMTARKTSVSRSTLAALGALAAVVVLAPITAGALASRGQTPAPKSPAPEASQARPDTAPPSEAKPEPTVIRDGQEVYRVGGDVKPPKLLKEVKPVYPREVMEDRVQGVVKLEAVVLENGTVGDVRVTQSLEPRLDDEAVSALKRWTFTPGTKDFVPVPVLVEIEMSFTLR